MAASPTSRRTLVAAAFVLLDAAYLSWVWAHFGNWGIWDWDLQFSLLEVARRSILEYGQLPLWNPYMAGGYSLVGHPLGRTFNPSFLPVLLFGTVAGVKLAILLYLLLGQLGMFMLARAVGARRLAAALSAVVFSLGGCFAQHLTHGHYEWLAYSWVPFVLWAQLRSCEKLTLRGALTGGVFLGLAFLDGGPYQYCFVPLFAGGFAGLLALKHHTPRPLLAFLAILVVAVGLAAVQIVPVLETVLESPRHTPVLNPYYGAPFDPSAGQLLYQSLLSRAQAHDPSRWMPFVINVGAYVGALPLLLAALALLGRPRESWLFGVLLLASLWVCLSPMAPLDVWALLHRLPGFASLQLPVRFNFFLLLSLAVLAGLGLDVVRQRAARLRWLGPLVVAAITLDLLAVNGPVFRESFSLPALELETEASFFHHLDSPYLADYPQRALYPIWPNWPNGTFPTVRQNTGVLRSYLDFAFNRKALPREHPEYPGREVWATDPEQQVTDVDFTPNAIAVRSDGPGGRIVVNQNHHRGWRVRDGNVGPVRRHRGLVSVKVPAGPQSFTLVFSPTSFWVGAWLSAASWLACGLLLWPRRTRDGPAARRGALVLLGVSLAAGAAGCSPDESAAPVSAGGVPRVILVSCDTLRADRLGVYGYERPVSPNLDAFAREALVFEEAYSSAPLTGPAMSSLLSSRLPDEIGMAAGNRSLMPSAVLTLPEVLSEAGIATAAVVSNWALRKPPRALGDVGVQQGFAHFDDRMGAEEPNRRGHFERLAGDTTDAALAWLDRRIEGDGSAESERFFLWVHYQDPHGPYTPPAELAAAFETPRDDAPPLALGRNNLGYQQLPAYQALGERRDAGFYSDRYDAEIRYFDQELGRLLEGLRERALYEDALIIVTADHGESIGEHEFWFSHEEHVFREVVRVPFLVRYPAGVTRPPGPRTRELVGHLDVWPTVLEAFGLAPRPSRGTSLLTESLPSGRVVAHTLGRDGDPGRWVGVSDGRYRLLKHGRGAHLFDLERDPGEERDVGRRQRSRADELWRRYGELLEDAPSPPLTEGVDMYLDADTREALRAMGYLEPDEP